MGNTGTLSLSVAATRSAAASPALESDIQSALRLSSRVRLAGSVMGVAAILAVIADDHIIELACIVGMAAALVWVSRSLASATRDIVDSRQRTLISEGRLALAMEGTNDGLWEWDLTTGVAYMSPRWLSMLGYDANEVDPSHTGFLALLHPDDKAGVTKDIQDYLDGRKPQLRTEIRLRHKNGQYIPMLARASVGRAPDGKPVRLVGTLLDLSDLRRAETALGTMERKYHDMVEQSPEGIYQMGLDGSVLSANQACAHMLGYESADELVSAPGIMQRVIVNPERMAALNKTLVEVGSVIGFEGRLRRKDGTIVWVSNTARAVRDDAGRVTSIEGFLEDITARKEADQMKSDFVSFVSHQLRTPLAGIKWLLELADTDALPAETESFIADARLSADRLIHLVNDLLDVSRLEGGRMVVNPAAVDFAAITAEVVTEVQPLAAEKDLQVEPPVSVGVPRAWMDPKLAGEVVRNLLTNAIRYTPSGGRITINIEHKGGLIEWSVRDTGIGIPAVLQPRLFEKFFRADNAWAVHTEGTGLGLYIVRLIVERSGGRAWFESLEGTGSTFHFTAPVSEAT